MITIWQVEFVKVIEELIDDHIRSLFRVEYKEH